MQEKDVYTKILTEIIATPLFIVITSFTFCSLIASAVCNAFELLQKAAEPLILLLHNSFVKF